MGVAEELPPPAPCWSSPKRINFICWIIFEFSSIIYRIMNERRRRFTFVIDSGLEAIKAASSILVKLSFNAFATSRGFCRLELEEPPMLLNKKAIAGVREAWGFYREKVAKHSSFSNAFHVCAKRSDVEL